MENDATYYLEIIDETVWEHNDPRFIAEALSEYHDLWRPKIWYTVAIL